MFRLDQMNSSEFHSYLSYAVKSYAAEHVRAGNWSEEEAFDKATKEYETLLPDGEKTSNHYLYTIRDNDENVGMIWLGKRSNGGGFIYDIHIWEDYQGRGYGKQAMKAIEEKAKNLGLNSIRLHVFGHNKVAHALYGKLGYIETDIMMEKKI